jgi:outer membrane protein OmpA-like peptidoglycan-associated protein
MAPNGDITLFGDEISLDADEINFYGPVNKEITSPPAAPVVAVAEPQAVVDIPQLPDEAEAPNQQKAVCELIYLPDQDLVIPLTPNELVKLEQEEQIMDDLVRRTLEGVDIEQIRQAKLDLSQHINDKVLVKGSPADYAEIHRIGGQKWSFVPRKLIENFKQGGTKSFSLKNAVLSAGEPLPDQSPEPLRTEDGRLNIRRIKEQFGQIGMKIEEEWDVVEPKSGQFSIRHLLYAGGLPAPDAAVDQLDQWIGALNRNLQWSTSEKMRARDKIVELLEQTEVKQPWYKKLFHNDDAPHYRIFDEDDLGLVRDTVEEIWGDQPDQAAWVERIKQLTLEEADPGQLADDIRSRPLPESRYSADARAQLMRYTYGITAAVNFDPAKGKLSAEAQAELDLALFEGKASGKVLLPGPQGQNIDVFVIRRGYQDRYEQQGHASPSHPTFAFNKTFLTVPAMQTINAAFDRWYAGNSNRLIHHQKGPNCKLQLTGHADRPGNEAYNRRISLQRAKVVYGYLTQNPAPWLEMFLLPENQGNWGPREIRAMLNALGYNETDAYQHLIDFQSLINKARETIGLNHLLGPPVESNLKVSKVTLYLLINEYMKKGGLKNQLKETHFLDPPFIGAGESAPVIDTPGPAEQNRRVSWTLYKIKDVDPIEEKKRVPLGDMRVCLECHLGGYVGANLLAGAHIHCDINPSDAKAGERGRLLARGVKTLGPEAGGEVSAFAGARGEAGIKGVLQWKRPESASKELEQQGEFVDLGSVGYTLIGQVGAALTGNIQIGFDETSEKFIIKVEASAALGPGFGGKLAFAVGIKHTYNFIAMVYTQLRDNDFGFVDFFEHCEEVNVFDLFCSWSYRMLLKGRLTEAGVLGIGAVGVRVAGSVADMTRTWKREWEESQHVDQLIENINGNAEMLRYTTPEVKGRILYLLIRPDEFGYSRETWIDLLASDRKQAVATVLAWIQSKRDCREVLEHMGVDIPQGDAITDKTRRAEQNQLYIIEYLEGLGVGEREWQKWHNDLPDKAATDRLAMRQSPTDYAK